ncbi:MAG: 50S ribosomal protein L3 [Elusimicrobiota bacterium]|jgi:large subunit ribosomal protein L3|nr:50S ribosomal protein L3 [Elusimicrobiota bacterium]
MLKSIIAKKLGMTQVFDERGNLIPVTLLEAGPCVVTDIRTKEKNGYSAVQLGFIDVKEKKLSKSQLGKFKVNNLPYKKVLREFKDNDNGDIAVGQEIKVDIFKSGDYVDVSGITKGKGYAGVIKRHNFGMQPTTHGQSDRTRARGSSGGQGPQRVLKGMRMSGHLGMDRVTIQKLLVVNVDPIKNLMFVKGAVPSSESNIILINKTVKKVPVPKPQKVKSTSKVAPKKK